MMKDWRLGMINCQANRNIVFAGRGIYALDSKSGSAYFVFTFKALGLGLFLSRKALPKLLISI
jgi:hypothetical protein